MKILFKYIALCLFVVFISCDKPEAVTSAKVETLEASEVTDHTALCKGKIIDRGSGTIARYGIELDDGSGFKPFQRTMTSGNDFGVQLNSLVPNKTRSEERRVGKEYES